MAACARRTIRRNLNALTCKKAPQENAEEEASQDAQENAVAATAAG
jgi:hypothetical protein